MMYYLKFEKKLGLHPFASQTQIRFHVRYLLEPFNTNYHRVQNFKNLYRNIMAVCLLQLVFDCVDLPDSLSAARILNGSKPSY